MTTSSKVLKARSGGSKGAERSTSSASVPPPLHHLRTSLPEKRVTLAVTASTASNLFHPFAPPAFYYGFPPPDFQPPPAVLLFFSDCSSSLTSRGFSTLHQSHISGRAVKPDAGVLSASAVQICRHFARFRSVVAVQN